MKHALKRILVLRDENVRFVPSLIDFPKRSSFDKGEHYIFPRILHWTRSAIGSKIKKARRRGGENGKARHREEIGAARLGMCGAAE